MAGRRMSVVVLILMLVARSFDQLNQREYRGHEKLDVSAAVGYGRIGVAYRTEVGRKKFVPSNGEICHDVCHMVGDIIASSM
jgi:hypothetical protein